MQLRVLDERFQLYTSINWCFMHQATIGLFGNHIVKAVVNKIKATLRNDSYTKGKFGDGRTKYFFSEAAQEEVFTRMLGRLTRFESPAAGFQITAKYAAHVRRVFLEDHSSFTACRIELLMIALPFVLRDLLAPEIALLAHEISNGRVKTVDGETPELPEDPCQDMIKALACFLDWYMLARKLNFPVGMAPELQRRAFVMKRELQRVFTEKNWKFPKFHSPNHKSAEILTFASSPYTETAMFEGGHKPNIKDLSVNSNGKDQFMIISKFHDRVSALSKLGQAAARHAQYLTAGSESDSNSDADHDEDDLFTDPLTSRPCEMAAKMPLWDISFDTEPGGLRREPFSIGAKGRGRQRLVIAACMAGAPAQQRQALVSNDDRINAKFSYNHATDYPALRYLPAQLCHFAHEYLRDSLGLEDMPEDRRDVHGVLDRCLVREADGTDIFTFGGIAIRSRHHKGTVRVRSRPFAGDQFFGRNPQVCSTLSKHSCVLVFL